MPRNRRDRQRDMERRERRDMRRDMRRDRARGRQPRNRYGEFMRDRQRDRQMGGGDGHLPPYYRGGVEPYLEMAYGYDYAGNYGGQGQGQGQGGQSGGDRRGDYGYGYDYAGDYARGGRGGRRDRQGGGRGGRRDRMPDYAGEEDGEYLDEEELKEWGEELLNELQPQEKEMFAKDKIIRRAEMMGIKSEEFTPEELYVTALMIFSDYKNSVGTNNAEIYIRMAKDFLDDKDAEIKGGEKLAVYYDEIVCADMEE